MLQLLVIRADALTVAARIRANPFVELLNEVVVVMKSDVIGSFGGTAVRMLKQQGSLPDSQLI
ncbi:hypothetical protein D3C76_1520710 [compost metagenome]